MEKGISELEQSVVTRRSGWLRKYGRKFVFLLVEIVAIVVLHAMKINRTGSGEKHAGNKAKLTRRVV